MSRLEDIATNLKNFALSAARLFSTDEQLIKLKKITV